jgi:hypothetical protein
MQQPISTFQTFAARLKSALARSAIALNSTFNCSLFLLAHVILDML